MSQKGKSEFCWGGEGGWLGGRQVKKVSGGLRVYKVLLDDGDKGLFGVV